MPPPPVRVTRATQLPTKILTVDYAAEAWTDDATELVKALLKINGVAGAKVGEKGKITITQDGKTDPDLEEIKKQIKAAGMTYKTLVAE